MGQIFTSGGAVVAFYIGLNALILLGLGVLTMRMRVKTRTPIGAGKDDLMRPMRAHANAAEYAPITLLVMGGLATLGATLGLLHILGAGLTLGRIFHAAGLLKTTGPSLERTLGMAFTWSTLGIGAVGLLFMSVAG